MENDWKRNQFSMPETKWLFPFSQHGQNAFLGTLLRRFTTNPKTGKCLSCTRSDGDDAGVGRKGMSTQVSTYVERAGEHKDVRQDQAWINNGLVVVTDGVFSLNDMLEEALNRHTRLPCTWEKDLLPSGNFSESTGNLYGASLANEGRLQGVFVGFERSGSSWPHRGKAGKWQR